MAFLTLVVHHINHIHQTPAGIPVASEGQASRVQDARHRAGRTIKQLGGPPRGDHAMAAHDAHRRVQRGLVSLHVQLGHPAVGTDQRATAHLNRGALGARAFQHCTHCDLLQPCSMKHSHPIIFLTKLTVGMFGGY